MLKKVYTYFLVKRASFAVFTIVFLGSLAWSLTMVRSGLCFDKDCASGIGFWGANGHDGVWHLALIKSLSSGSLENPVFAGEMIKNYHLGYDFILSLVYRFFAIDPLLLYFQIFPPILAILIGVLTSKMVSLLTTSKLAIFWALFFVYFGGGFGWIVSLVRDGRLGGDSMFWAQSSPTTLVNPPFALSLVFFILGIIFFNKYIKHNKKVALFLTAFLWGSLVQIKIYAGILVLGSLSSLFLYSIFFRKDKAKALLKVLGLTCFISFVFFLPLGKTSASLIEFRPFWFLETMMLFGDRFYWEEFYNAMVNYFSGKIYLKGFLAYFLAFVIFIVGNLGTRVVSIYWFFRSFKSFKKWGLIQAFLVFLLLIGVLLPMIFVQKGTPWNTIQFFYYSLFIFGIFSGLAFSRLFLILNNLKVRLLFAVLLVFITLPTTIVTMGHYLPVYPQARISRNELSALRFLASQPKGVVLSLQVPGTTYENKSFPTPLYAYESTAYVAAFSNKPVYLEDVVNLNIMNYDWTKRLDKVVAFLEDTNSLSGKLFLRESGVSYIYLVKRKGVILDEKSLGIVNIYDNEEVIVYMVL